MKRYLKTLFLAFIGTRLIDDRPIREAHGLEISDLYSEIPFEIEGATGKTSSENLVWMLDQLSLDWNNSYPIDKQGRWIGFIHGVLAVTKHINVDQIRNRSRARYHRAYKETGQVIPKTKERKS